jgi:hypothetical protein
VGQAAVAPCISARNGQKFVVMFRLADWSLMSTMDRAYIESQEVVDRYLSGDLLVREARAFEKYCLEHPDFLARLPIPVRLKTRLARRPFDDSETGVFPTIPSTTTLAAVEIADEPGDELSANGPVNGAEHKKRLAIIAAAVLVAGAGIAWHFVSTGNLEARIASLSSSAETLRLKPPSGVQSYKLIPGTQGPQSAPNTAIGWPDPPQLLELRIDVTNIRFNSFSMTIEKAGEARIMQIRRIAPDSNRELRVALNSSAFGPGDYLLDLQGYTWRGELVDAGWMRIRLQ